MSRPPLLLHLRIPTDSGYVGVWLPWFLVYPVLLALMLVALPIVILLAIIALPTGHIRALFLGGLYVWRLLFDMRGLSVDVQSGQRKVLINFV